ncbi:MAG: NAD(P)H-hydrate dehydratase [Nitrospirae bacterium]|nr:MAG: NAD(P)H-hydrate dehydratase [Nitrospirota bacterium]
MSIPAAYYLVTAAEMRTLDHRTIHEAHVPGTTLMERAGTGVVNALESLKGRPTGKKVVVFCGKGNNGGDGFVVARLLKRKRANVQVLLLAPPSDLSSDANVMYQRFQTIAGTASIRIQPSAEVMHDSAQEADILVDALLGTGLSAPIREPYRSAIGAINASPAWTVAVDLPSGIHSDTGAVLGDAVRADLTVTFGCPKVGLYLGEAIDYAGIIQTVDIGIPLQFVEALSIRTFLLGPEMIAPLIPPRPRSAHKGRYGHAAIIAGSPGKTGAATMTARAALRVGTGLVTVATPRTANMILESKMIEAMTCPLPETPSHTLGLEAVQELSTFTDGKSAVAIGPGLSTHPETCEMVRTILPRLTPPCVIDADGLNALAGQTAILSNCRHPPILTPHPGEMARLLGSTTAKAINEDRLGIARRFATAHNVILVLKGARTVIADPRGYAAICPTGNPGMATAGMGDALTGMITGFLAQGLSSWQAAQAGVYLHGLAGDLAANEKGYAGLIAGDLIERIPDAITSTLRA